MLGPSLNVARDQAKALSERGALSPAEVRSRYRELNRSLVMIRQQVELVGSMKPRARQRRTVDLTAELTAAAGYLAPVMDRHSIKLEVDVPRRGTFRAEMRPEDLHRVLNILIQNSVEWMKSSSRRRIQLSAKRIGETCSLSWLAIRGLESTRPWATRFSQLAIPAVRQGRG